MPVLRLSLLLLLLALSGCPAPRSTQSDSSAQPAAVPEESTARDTATAAEPVNGELLAPKQLVIIYSGNTHARLLPSGLAEYDNLTGGLPALASAISQLELEVVNYNRMRIANNGGDASSVRVDLDGGMLGEHPFMLLDYGGWEGYDLQEHPERTALLLEAMAQMRYTAVAMRDWQLLTLEELQLIATFDPVPPLLNTPGEQPQSVPSLTRVLLRDVFGQSWGIASLPRRTEMDREKYEQYIMVLVDECANELEISGAEFRILLAGDQTGDIYRQLLHDKRFDVVIGAPGAMSAVVGFDNLPTDGPLFLPGLADGGTQLASCHLIWEGDSERPLSYFYEWRSVVDDNSGKLPWQQRIAELDSGH